MIRRPRGWRVPILMYHRVVESEAEAPGYFFAIPRRRFLAQMRCLQALRYRAVSLGHVLEWLEGKRALPLRAVALTFDDGYEDTYRLAAPILERCGFRATIFLVADYVGGHSVWDAEPDGSAPLMSWEQARDLARRGFSLGSHSLTHAELPFLDHTALRAELHASRRVLEQRLGLPVRYFAYPYNLADDRCHDAVRIAGYQAACGGDGRSYHRWHLDRVDVSHAPLPVFLAKVSPWFYTFRHARTRRRAG